MPSSTINPNVVLTAVQLFRRQYGIMPTQRDLRQITGIGSLAAVHRIFMQLLREGNLDSREPRLEDACVHIPLVDDISASGPSSTPTPERLLSADEHLAIPTSWFARAKTFSLHYALRVVGDHFVENNFKDGDIVVLRLPPLLHPKKEIHFPLFGYDKRHGTVRFFQGSSLPETVQPLGQFVYMFRRG